MILEGIVTSLDERGELNIAPMGPLVDESMVTLRLRPFKTSQTYQNLKVRPCGVFHVVGTPARVVDWWTVAREGSDLALSETTMFTGAMTFPFGAHLAVVEIDDETGESRVVQLVAVDDAGTIVNPVIADGQLHGGLAQGVAEALYEGVVFDEDGQPLTTNFTDYAIVSAAG